MQPTKIHIRLLILLYISVMYNLRYFLTLLLYSESRQALFHISPGSPRWIIMLAIYLPVAVCIGLGIVLVRYFSPVFRKSSNRVVRVLFVLWAAVTLFFPLAVNKVYFTLPFTMGYGVVYLLLSWVMVSLERWKGK